MTLIEALWGKKGAAPSGLAAMFAPRKKRHKLPAWAAQKAAAAKKD